ncbi:hypothetical protein DQ241_17020 [Blastococcus sp. TF02A-30]|nr:hypothetical protein DQ241_17020 [Blastococcus sp. TF02A-30]
MWPAVLLMAVATGLAAAGALVVLRPQESGAEEAGVRRAITGLGLLGAAVAAAAIGAGELAADRSGAVQIGAFAGGVAAVALPVTVVGLALRARRAR